MTRAKKAGAVLQGKGSSRVTVGIKTLPVEETHSSSDAAAVQSAHSRARAGLPAVLTALRGGTPINHACALAGIPRRSFYAMLDADEEVRTDVEKARATGAEVYRGSIVSIASGGVEGGNANVLLHLMERLYPDDYAPPKTRTEVSGPEGKPQEHRVVLTTEQRNAGARDGSVPEEV